MQESTLSTGYQIGEGREAQLAVQEDSLPNGEAPGPSGRDRTSLMSSTDSPIILLAGDAFVDSFDYGQAGGWEALTEALTSRFSPRPGKVFGHVICQPGWRWSREHRDYNMWLVTAGRGSGKVAGQTVSLVPGTLLLLRPGMQVDICQDESSRLTVTYVHFDFVRPGSRSRLTLPGSLLPSVCIPLVDVHRVSLPLLRAVQLLEEGGRLDLFEAQLLLTQALIEVYRQDAYRQGIGRRLKDPRVRRVLQQLKRNPAVRLSLSQAAEVAGTTPRYLSKLFHRELGSSFRQYSEVMRMERAHALLVDTTMSVSQVARLLGYKDAALFSRQYRRYSGTAPSQIRSDGEGAVRSRPWPSRSWKGLSDYVSYKERYTRERSS